MILLARYSATTEATGRCVCSWRSPMISMAVSRLRRSNLMSLLGMTLTARCVGNLFGFAFMNGVVLVQSSIYKIGVIYVISCSTIITDGLKKIWFRQTFVFETKTKFHHNSRVMTDPDLNIGWLFRKLWKTRISAWLAQVTINTEPHVPIKVTVVCLTRNPG